MDQRPLTIMPHPDRNWVHDSAAGRGTISRLDVQMNAMKAVRAMVAMVRACACEHDERAAVAAVEPILLSLGLPRGVVMPSPPISAGGTPILI